MDLSINQKRKLQQTWVLLAIGTSLGPLYIIFSDGFGRLLPFINGTIISFLISCVIAFFEIWMLTAGMRRIRFIYLILLRTLLYLMVIFMITFTVIIMSRMIVNQQSFSEVINDDAFRNYIFRGDFRLAILYGVAFALIINFTRMISRKMGQGMLLSHISGTYFSPVKEERIIMFMKVVNSQMISERLGPLKLHSFLNELFYDITDPIIHRRAIIYEYVEDLVVMSWAEKKGVQDANCIRVYFDIQDTLEANKERYFNKFGFVPRLKAAAHFGLLVRAEIGDIKTQIAFQGDVLNTTSRILDMCDEHNIDLLISARLSYRLLLPPLFVRESVGTIKLKGKEERVELFAISEAKIESIA